MASTVLALLACAAPPRPATAQQKPESQSLDRDFQSAVAQYEAGQFQQAAAQLEKLLTRVPQSFQVHELLGLAYAAQSQNERAREHFKKAVALKADSYDANHNLGELYVRSNQPVDAIPYLERAQRANPSAYDNGYDLALAYLLTNRLGEARQLIQSLIKQKDTAELHNLLAEVEEKSGNFVAAVKEFQRAAYMDPSEENIFDWGSELLLHRTLEPAIEVFQKGTERFPDSARMAIGLGMAYYSLGRYDDAVKSLLRAADLAPADPRTYPFLSRAFDSSPSQAEDVIERFHRYAESEPDSGQALYYYAISLWKGKRAQDPNVDLSQIESLLKKSVALAPNLAEAHQQLANLYSDQRKYSESIPEYLKARQLDPDLADVHYRLAQAYVRTGEKELAEGELKIYQQLRAQHLSDLDKQRAEIRQFVYSEKQGSEAKP
jgi:tetratricopeptide (TPR) repeat protein